MIKSLSMNALSLISLSFLASANAFAAQQLPPFPVQNMKLLFQCSDGANESDDAQPVQILAAEPDSTGFVALRIIDSSGNRYFAISSREEFALLSQKKPVPIVATAMEGFDLAGPPAKKVVFSFGTYSDGWGPRAYLSKPGPVVPLTCQISPGRGFSCDNGHYPEHYMESATGGHDASTGLNSVLFLDASEQLLYTANMSQEDARLLLQGKPVPALASTADGFPIEDSYVNTGIFSFTAKTPEPNGANASVSRVNAVLSAPTSVSTIHNCQTPAEIARRRQAAHAAPRTSDRAAPPTPAAVTTPLAIGAVDAGSARP